MFLYHLDGLVALAHGGKLKVGAVRLDWRHSRWISDASKCDFMLSRIGLTAVLSVYFVVHFDNMFIRLIPPACQLNDKIDQFRKYA